MGGKRKQGRSEKFHGGRGVNFLGRGAYLSAYYKFITCVLFLCLSVLFTDKKKGAVIWKNINSHASLIK